MSHIRKTILSIFIISAFIFTGFVSPSIAGEQNEAVLVAYSHGDKEKHKCEGDDCKEKHERMEKKHKKMHDKMHDDKEHGDDHGDEHGDDDDDGLV
jgi:hypothetical protein